MRIISLLLTVITLFVMAAPAAAFIIAVIETTQAEPQNEEGIILTAEGPDYTVKVACGPETEIPADAVLSVREIEDWKVGEEEIPSRHELAFSRAFDISILNAEGEKIPPKSDVRVSIDLPEANDAETIQVLHYADEEEPLSVEEELSPEEEELPVEKGAESLRGLKRGIDTSDLQFGKQSLRGESAGLLGVSPDEPENSDGVVVTHSDGEELPAEEEERHTDGESEQTVEEPVVGEPLDATVEDGIVSFSTGSFSIFAVIGFRMLEKRVIAANGAAYDITVIYGPEAGIPDDASLEVEELIERTDFDPYLTRTRDVFGMEEIGYARFFDISIVADGETIQPVEGSTVSVQISLVGVESEDLQVIHFGADPEVIKTTIEDGTVSFDASSFSVYAVVDLNSTELDGNSFCIIQTKGGDKPSGIALKAVAQGTNKLQGSATTVRVDTVSRTENVYVANNSNITMWTFNENVDGKYLITAEVGGATKYLQLKSDGVYLADNSDVDCIFTVKEGTGTNKGKVKLGNDNGTLRLNGSNFERAQSNFNSADAWMNLAGLSELNDTDFITYTAHKVSIAENKGEVLSGDLVIVYTRIWNDEKHKYDYYVVDYDGKLVLAYESGDKISWVGSRVNTMLWDFTEYYDQNTHAPNGYYELQNTHSNLFIAPKTSNGSGTFLSDNPIGINLYGRDENEYYTTILAWDDYYYASLKVDENNIGLLSSTRLKASDFYFAKMTVEESTMEVTTVSTVDSTGHGIIMKMQDFGENDNLSGGRSAEMDSILGKTSYVQWVGTKNLLSKYIAEGGYGYPVATYSKKSLSELFNNTMEVNNQFLTSTYYETGYYEYDSTKNFSHLITSEDDLWYGLTAPNGKTYDVGDFVVYNQLGTSSESNKDTLKHGQFFPYNDLIVGFQKDENGDYILDSEGNPIPISINVSQRYQNTTDIHANPISSLDPSYGEALYEIHWDKTHEAPSVDHFFGMEMSTGFMQTEAGVDEWGHDLVFEFSGDDDFWLYVDNVLVMDLGGIHSALDGSVNFKTGDIIENGTHFTLRDRFKDAYKAQYPTATDNEVNNWLRSIFKVEKKIVNGEEKEEITSVFKDYSSHSMRMFYLERGAGASNIRMRFNLSEYKEGRVQLEKVVSGTENIDQPFPFQVWYKDSDSGEFVLASLNLKVADAKTDVEIPYMPEYSVQVGSNTLTYNNVFLVQAGQIVNIDLPSEDTEYYIKECAIDSDTYDWVKINDITTAETPVTPQKYNSEDVTNETIIEADGYNDYNTTNDLVSQRKKVIYENHVSDSALKSLTITKKLWQDEAMTIPILSGTDENADNTEFSYRVYIGMDGENYKIYQNGPYRVKNPDGEYCYYYNGGFVSTGKTVFSEISDDIVNNNPEILLGDTLQERCTFHTGRGSISKIKADYIVEIPGLMGGTPYVVVERDGEIPDGYNRLGYAKDGSDAVLGETDSGHTEESINQLLVNGELNDNQNVYVHNQHGYTLIGNKVWSDAPFMENHDHIYFAVFLKEGDNLSYIDGSLRQLGKTEAKIKWFFPELAEGKNLNDYEVYEVKLNIPEGSSLESVAVDLYGKVTGYTTIAGGETVTWEISGDRITRVEEGGVLVAGGETSEHGYSASMEYVASYSREVLTAGEDGKYPTNRTDNITNSRPGIKIVKTDYAGQPLEGAKFTLSNGSDKMKYFTSDETGLIVVAYLLPDFDYYLEEIAAPYGYQTLINEILTIRVDGGGELYVNNSINNQASGYYTVTQASEPTVTNMPTITIKNKDSLIKAVKIDSYTNTPMAGVEFSLYKEVYASTNGLPDPNRPMPFYTPMEGYESLITDSNGNIPYIVLKNSENPNGLPAGSYYLREKETYPGYNTLVNDIRITIKITGEVILESAIRPTSQNADWTITTISDDIAEIREITESERTFLQITIKNTPKDPVRIKKVVMGSDVTLAGVGFELYRFNQIQTNGLPGPGENPVVEAVTDENGILNLGGLDGLYYLFETQPLPGYNALEGAIQINASADADKVSVSYVGGSPLECKKVKDINGKDVWQITIPNSTGYQLPSTGSSAMRTLSAMGTALALLSGAGYTLNSLHTARKRRRGESPADKV